MEKLGISTEFFKNEIKKEKIIQLDFCYLSALIEDWWEYVTDLTPSHLAKFQLIHLILRNCKKEEMYFFDKLGTNNISAICVSNVFSNDNPKLALIVHEALSELFGLNDIKFPYEEHKKLFLKKSGVDYKNWGNGYGEITPHSDDLYEDFEVDFLSLTVCRDTTNTPTLFYFPRDILYNFSDPELSRLLSAKAKFLSGKNVNIPKYRERSIVDFNAQSGFKFFLDFRIDNDVGERMLPVFSEDEEIFNKMRENIRACPYNEAIPKTGNFLIVANHKILHARQQMRINRSLAKRISENANLNSVPRLLYRSKGQDAKAFNIL